MRLIRQSLLWYKEGNSDKVYEIDLCEVGADKYVVNFRYGRRGAAVSYTHLDVYKRQIQNGGGGKYCQ